MQEAYELYKKFYPESTITFEEWVNTKPTTTHISDDFQIGPEDAFEYEDDLKDWDNTLMDGLENE